MTRLGRLSIRWRLALTSAGLTMAILMLFAVALEVFTARQLHQSFDDEVRSTAADLQDRIGVRMGAFGGVRLVPGEDLVQVAAAGGGALRVVDTEGRVLAQTAGAPKLGTPGESPTDSSGYRTVARPLFAPDGPARAVAFVQYAKPLRSVRKDIARVQLFLAFGVLGGTLLALLAGLAVARRAMSPIARLTQAAKEIARTRDPAIELPMPETDDEISDLAHTLDEMLHALDESQEETEAALTRQREFVADASHELRTPLTSILANLELLEAALEGDDAEVAASALRSSRRMRRLVADLLLLARADAGREQPHRPVDMAGILRDAAGEVAPMAGNHELEVHAERVEVSGSPDDLHRLALNLFENALVHSPAGSRVHATVWPEDGEAVLRVEDDGPGIPLDQRERVFERFARGEGDASQAGGSGLGLAIVRAVAESHAGTVELDEAPHGGARFTVRLPAQEEGEAGRSPDVHGRQDAESQVGTAGLEDPRR